MTMDIEATSKLLATAKATVLHPRHHAIYELTTIGEAAQNEGGPS